MKNLIDVAAGVAGGLLGTFFITQMTKLGGRLPKRFQTRMHGDPREFILDKAEDLLGRRLSDNRREQMKPALQWTYGLAGPLVLGAAARRIGRGSLGRTLAAGAIMGGIVWAVGYLGWMPLGGVAEPIHRQPVGATAQNLLGHAAYGVVSALPVALTERFV
jgi:hypothetical protein